MTAESIAYKSGDGIIPGLVCWKGACMEDPHYRFIGSGRLIVVCFGHGAWYREMYGGVLERKI